jgi:hypothetical protein
MVETPWAETNQHSQDRGEGFCNYLWFHSLPELPDICNRTTFKLVWQNLITRGLDTANYLAFVQARGLILFGSECTRQFVKEAIPLQDNLCEGRKWTTALWLQFPSYPSNQFLTSAFPYLIAIFDLLSGRKNYLLFRCGVLYLPFRSAD